MYVANINKYSNIATANNKYQNVFDAVDFSYIFFTVAVVILERLYLF